MLSDTPSITAIVTTYRRAGNRGSRSGRADLYPMAGSCAASSSCVFGSSQTIARPAAISRPAPRSTIKCALAVTPCAASHDPAEQHRDHQVHVAAELAAPVAAERDVEVVAQESRERHVPAPPEIGDVH